MGDYVQPSSLPNFNMIMENKSSYVDPSSPWQTVTERFDESMAIANDMLENLVGDDGTSGYLGDLNALLVSYSVPDYGDIATNIPDFVPSTISKPTLGSVPLLDEIPDFTTSDPILKPLPTVDTSGVIPTTPPSEVNPTIDWSEIPYSSDVYSDLLARILNDLQSGATGLDPTVEQEIWNRAIARQVTENDAKYQEIETYFAARGYTLPPGALAGRLAESNSEILRSNTDLNGKILIEQADLAQKNSQFIITQAVALENIIRDFASRESDRDLDYQKAVADLVLKNYVEEVRAYLAVAEANKIYVEIQVENLRAVVSYNDGLISSYNGLVNAYTSKVGAIASKNKSEIDGFSGEVMGFEAEHKAIVADQTVELEQYKTKLEKADIQLREFLTNVEAGIKGYEVEMSTRERVASSMATIASQSVASALSSVNASASLGYSGSESLQESFSHNSSQSESLSYSAQLSESHNYEET